MYNISMKERDIMSKSFKSVWEAFVIVCNSLIQKFPILLIFVFAIGINVAWLFFTLSSNFFMISISILILLSSIIMYSKDSSGVTITFMVSLLTIFSIDWNENPGYKVIFFALYTSYIVIVGLVSSIKIASRRESILIQASGYINVDKKELEKLVNEAKGENLSILEKSEVVRYLAVRGMDIEDIRAAVEEINIIKLAFQLNLDQSMRYYYTLYQIMKIKKVEFINVQIRKVLDMTFEFPLEPYEVLELISTIKSDLLRSENSPLAFLRLVKQLLEEGMDSNEIKEYVST